MISMTWPQYLRRECQADGRVIKLTPQLTEILFLLMVRAPNRVSTEELIEYIYPNPDFEPEFARSVITMRITELRRRVGFWCIETRWGWGYAFVHTQSRMAA